MHLNRKICTLIFLSLIIFSSQSGYAQERKILICRAVAEKYSVYAVHADEWFRTLNDYEKRLDFSKPNEAAAYKESVKKLISAHEDFKDREYTSLREKYEGLVASKQLDMLDAETIRMYLEAGIDMAWIAVGENWKKDTLNKNKEHYYRKIRDECMSPDKKN